MEGRIPLLFAVITELRDFQIKGDIQKWTLETIKKFKAVATVLKIFHGPKIQ